MRNLSYENEYDLHSNGLVSKTHFHMKGFALGLVLKQRQKRTRKWPIETSHLSRRYFPRSFAKCLNENFEIRQFNKLTKMAPFCSIS